MTRIVIDESLKCRLNELREGVEFCDASGRFVGFFIPSPKTVDDEQVLSPPLSEDELKRRLNEETFSTAQVITHLDGLSCSHSGGPARH
jgi:hypothetical protein